MRLRQLGLEWAMTLRRVARNRIALALLLLLPGIFFAVARVTTTPRPVAVEVASVPWEEMLMPPLLAPQHAGTARRGAILEAPQRSLALVFVSVAAVGVVAALLALDLAQKDAGATRRLVLCGRRPGEIIAARLLALLCVVGVAAAGVAAALFSLVAPERMGLAVAGLGLAGWIYGCFGLLAGSVFRRDLAGVLAVAILANVDAGWLQNAIYYAGAPNKLLIRALPAHGPAQLALVGAFSDYPAGPALLASLVHGVGLLAAAIAAFAWRMRVHRTGRA